MLRRTHRNQRTPRPDTTQPISSRQAHHPTQHLGKISDRQWGNSKIRSNASIGPNERRGLTPLFWSHINPYGRFQLDMTTSLDLNQQTRESIL